MPQKKICMPQKKISLTFPPTMLIPIPFPPLASPLLTSTVLVVPQCFWSMSSTSWAEVPPLLLQLLLVTTGGGGQRVTVIGRSSSSNEGG